MLTLECNYSKKIGLPGYSSHQFMVTLRTEISDVNTVQVESDRVYGLLQAAVDASLQKVGWLPQLKIEAEGDYWYGRTKPKIRLTGHWLARAGFSPGKQVRVICVAPGLIELRSPA